MLLVILAYAGNGEAEDCVELGPVAHGSPLREGGVFLPLFGRPRFRGATLRRGPSLIHPPPRVVGLARAAGMLLKKKKTDGRQKSVAIFGSSQCFVIAHI